MTKPPKAIWVRARDDAGNTSEIVKVGCVLDTVPPAELTITPVFDGTTRWLELSGLEALARWEYALEGFSGWRQGHGPALGILGTSIPSVSFRQVDVAGNASQARNFQPHNAHFGTQKSSGDPKQPSVLAADLLTHLIHGVLAAGADSSVRWDVPVGHQLVSLQWLHLGLEGGLISFSLQLTAASDLKTVLQSMLAHGQVSDRDLNQNILSLTASGLLGHGPKVLGLSNPGPWPTPYAIEVVLAPIR